MAVTAAADPVERLTGELWTAGEVAKQAPAGEPGWVEHAIVEAGDTMVLLPLTPRRATAAALVRWTDAMSYKDIASRWAAAGGIRIGLGRAVLRNTVAIASGGRSEPTLHEHLAEALGVPTVAVAGGFGPPRPNQKPVLRVFDGAGETIGFAKVGWNDLTRGLVEHEAEFLASAASAHTDRIVVPGLAAVGSWRTRTVAVLKPLLGGPRLRRPPVPGPPVLNEVAGLADRYTTPIASSPHRRRSSHTAVDAALTTIDDLWGSRALPYGRWHGDWTPWNLATTGRRIIVWDWERTAADTPVGLDAIHFAFQTRLAAGAPSPVAALVDAVHTVTPVLHALGVPEGAVPAVACLYAVELELRFNGAASGAHPPVPWMDGLLDGTLRHFTVQ